MKKRLPCYHCGWEQINGLDHHRKRCPDHPENRKARPVFDYPELIPVGTYAFRFLGAGKALRRDIARHHAKQV